MKYVNIIRRINKIDTAISAAPTHDKYDDIVDALFNKRDMLVTQLKRYKNCPDKTNQELRKEYYGRRKQLRLACKLLNVDYFRIFH